MPPGVDTHTHTYRCMNKNDFEKAGSAVHTWFKNSDSKYKGSGLFTVPGKDVKVDAPAIEKGI